MEFIAAVMLAHLVGDYLLQSNWMANEKTKRWLPAILHGVTYTLPFLFITLSVPALLVICITHIVIDRFRLAKYVVWLKNQMAPKAGRYTWNSSTNDRSTGYPTDAPPWMAVWLLILADNSIHLVINVLSVVLLGDIWVVG